MASRFKDAPQWVWDLVARVRQEYFERDLMGAEILVLFDTKKRINQGRWVFGRLKKASDMERSLSESNILPDGYDYIMTLDREVFMRIGDTDRSRLVRHELRHGELVLTETGPVWRIRPHDIEDFEIEINLNEDDPQWIKRLAVVAESVYDSDSPPPIQDPTKPELPFDDGEDKGKTTKRKLRRGDYADSPVAGLIDAVDPGNSMSITIGGKGVKVTGEADGSKIIESIGENGAEA